MKKPFIDRVAVKARAGRGGDGCVSFRREKFVPRGGPDGGRGGKGGSVILQASKSINTLIDFHYRPELKAENGAHGRGKKKQGRAGKTLLLKVPRGTLVRDAISGRVIDDLVEDGRQLVLARGGRGGRGNSSFATSTNQAPRTAEKGEAGGEGEYLLELKLVADIGLVGYPNSGKSTLLSAISQARPKTASYPFTTLRPVLGVVEDEKYRKLTVADVPGLIEGAHRNVGLGHEFLRHIERSRALVLVLDMAAVDGRSPLSDYRDLRRELKLYEPSLVGKNFIVAANKMDLPAARENLEKFIRASHLSTGKVFAISALKKEGLEELKKGLFGLLPGGVGEG